MNADDVRNFVERDKALCAAALDHNPELILRAAEMISAVERNAARSPVVRFSDQVVDDERNDPGNRAIRDHMDRQLAQYLRD